RLSWQLSERYNRSPYLAPRASFFHSAKPCSGTRTEAFTSPMNAETLRPVPYHWAIRDYLKSEEPELWKWFSSTKVRQEHAEAVRLDLLKSTYRLDAASQPQLYGLAEEVLGQLQCKAPVTFYQAQCGGGLNASLALLPGEAHIILVGSIL